MYIEIVLFCSYVTQTRNRILFVRCLIKCRCCLLLFILVNTNTKTQEYVHVSVVALQVSNCRSQIALLTMNAAVIMAADAVA
jgi:hypothetical protein